VASHTLSSTVSHGRPFPFSQPMRIFSFPARVLPLTSEPGRQGPTQQANKALQPTRRHSPKYFFRSRPPARRHARTNSPDSPRRCRFSQIPPAHVLPGLRRRAACVRPSIPARPGSPISEQVTTTLTSLPRGAFLDWFVVCFLDGKLL
jgi:hypothetical protein